MKYTETPDILERLFGLCDARILTSSPVLADSLKYYTKRIMCSNCGDMNTFWIPRGMRWKEFSDNAFTCINCNCCAL